MRVALPDGTEHLKKNLHILVGRSFTYKDNKYVITEITKKNTMVCKDKRNAKVMKFSIGALAAMMNNNLMRWGN